jgi:Flp pilus assembly protein TadG
MRHTFGIHALRRRIREFCRADEGHVAVIFTLALLPVVGITGGAIDYSHATAVKASMQAALDATALALSREATSLTDTQLQERASAYFGAAFNRPEAPGVTVTATYTGGSGSTIRVKSSGKVKTHFLGILGINEIAISSTSKTKWGNKRLRVALALDVTGSMASSNKLTTLKPAVKNLLNQLKGVASTTDDVYVSIIPFSKDVNVGPGNYSSSWIRWDLWEARNGTCSNSSYSKKSTCTSNGHTWTPANHNTWNGCVTDRDQDYDTTNTAPTDANTATLFPAEQYSSCPAALMALSYDWTALTQKIDELQPAGNTNQTIGLQWAFQALTTNSPLAVPPKDPNYKYEDAIILLTDGMNTENRFTSSEWSIDQRMQATCNNVKAAGVIVYTVLVMAGNATLLQNCASDSSKYFALTSADQMIAAFNTIGTSLTKLRIAE